MLLTVTCMTLGRWIKSCNFVIAFVFWCTVSHNINVGHRHCYVCFREGWNLTRYKLALKLVRCVLKFVWAKNVSKCVKRGSSAGSEADMATTCITIPEQADLQISDKICSLKECLDHSQASPPNKGPAPRMFPDIPSRRSRDQHCP